MKGLEHHVRQFLRRMMQAQEVMDRAKAQRILKKAEKHQRKIRKITEAE